MRRGPEEPSLGDLRALPLESPFLEQGSLPSSGLSGKEPPCAVGTKHLEIKGEDNRRPLGVTANTEDNFGSLVFVMLGIKPVPALYGGSAYGPP